MADKKDLQHVGIIMDGNRRWAKSQGLSPEIGHEEGARRIEPLVEEAVKNKVKFLTFYSFSTENWKRSPFEVQKILQVFRTMLYDSTVDRLQGKGVRVNIIGSYKAFPSDIVQRVEEIHEMSKKNDVITVNFALNYGGRDEIIRAVSCLVEKKEKVTEKSLAELLDTSNQPDPDLIIRTGGERRLSNFLTWQSVYSELYFTDVLWPVFTPLEFQSALAWYKERERRFGS